MRCHGQPTSLRRPHLAPATVRAFRSTSYVVLARRFLDYRNAFPVVRSGRLEPSESALANLAEAARLLEEQSRLLEAEREESLSIVQQCTTRSKRLAARLDNLHDYRAKAAACRSSAGPTTATGSGATGSRRSPGRPAGPQSAPGTGHVGAAAAEVSRGGPNRVRSAGAGGAAAAAAAEAAASAPGRSPVPGTDSEEAQTRRLVSQALRRNIARGENNLALAQKLQQYLGLLRIELARVRQGDVALAVKILAEHRARTTAKAAAAANAAAETSPSAAVTSPPAAVTSPLAPSPSAAQSADPPERRPAAQPRPEVRTASGAATRPEGTAAVQARGAAAAAAVGGLRGRSTNSSGRSSAADHSDDAASSGGSVTSGGGDGGDGRGGDGGPDAAVGLGRMFSRRRLLELPGDSFDGEQDRQQQQQQQQQEERRDSDAGASGSGSSSRSSRSGQDGRTSAAAGAGGGGGGAGGDAGAGADGGSGATASGSGAAAAAAAAAGQAAATQRVPRQAPPSIASPQTAGAMAVPAANQGVGAVGDNGGGRGGDDSSEAAPADLGLSLVAARGLARDSEDARIALMGLINPGGSLPGPLQRAAAPPAGREPPPLPGAGASGSGSSSRSGANNGNGSGAGSPGADVGRAGAGRQGAAAGAVPAAAAAAVSAAAPPAKGRYALAGDQVPSRTTRIQGPSAAAAAAKAAVAAAAARAAAAAAADAAGRRPPGQRPGAPGGSTSAAGRPAGGPGSSGGGGAAEAEAKVLVALLAVMVSELKRSGYVGCDEQVDLAARQLERTLAAARAASAAAAAHAAVAGGGKSRGGLYGGMR